MRAGSSSADPGLQIPVTDWENVAISRVAAAIDGM